MVDKIKQIKYSRLSKEEIFFLDTIDGIQPFKSDKHPESIFWVKNGNVLLECNYSTKWIFVNYSLIWCYLEHRYNYSYMGVQLFILNFLKKHTNLGLLKPYTVTLSTLERHLNIESFEPRFFMDSDIFTIERHENLKKI